MLAEPRTPREAVQIMITIVSSLMWPKLMPRLQMTKANSLICERLIVDNAPKPATPRCAARSLGHAHEL